MCQFEETNLNTIPVKIVKLNCPRCKADLTAKQAIYYVGTGIKKSYMTYSVQNNWFDTEEEQFDSDGVIEEYTCIKCGIDVSTIIKNYI